MKRLTAKMLSLLLALVMTVTLFPTGVKADTSPRKIGTVNYYSTGEGNNIITDSYLYSDEWFFEDPTVRNDALALISMQLVAAAIDDRADGLGPAFLNELGFNETGYVKCADEDVNGCNYTWGKKTITGEDGDATLIAVQIQSSTFDQIYKSIGWTQNFHVNGDELTEEHFGLGEAYSSVLPDIASLGDGESNVIFWVTGQSRGGALAGMIASSLGEAGYNVYGYTFEAPAYIEDYAAPDCPYIHNYLCSDDIVTYLPPWNMVRCGDTFVLNTEESNAHLKEELDKLGSVMAESADAYLGFRGEDTCRKIMDTLTASIPTREAYSAVNIDTFPYGDGSMDIEYVYQDLFIKLAGIIFGGGIGDINTDAIMGNIGNLEPAVLSLVKAVRQDSMADYYDAALGLSEFLTQNGINIPLSPEEIYVLLRLAGPMLVDTDFEPDEENTPEGIVILYLVPAVELAGGANMLVYSHHFDTLIARLKQLVPSPDFEGIDILIDEPCAGDEISYAPSLVADFVDSVNQPWLTASAKWETEDEVLEDGHIYYLTAEVRCIGHSIPEDFTVTLNGALPVEGPSVSYADGASVVRATWLFVIGEPEQVNISFDTGEITASPEPVQVLKGSKLERSIVPPAFDIVENEDGRWKFGGWFDENGGSWKDVVADQDVVLHADWSGIIDKVDLTYPIPHVGDDLGTISVKEGTHIEIDALEFIDSRWNTYTKAESTDPLIAFFYVRPSSGYVMMLPEDEEGLPRFDGTVTVNGSIISPDDIEGYDEDGYISVKYRFNPLPAESETTITPTPGEEEPTVTPTPGDDKPTITPTPGDDKPTVTPTPAGNKPTVTPTPRVKTKTPTPTVKPQACTRTDGGGTSTTRYVENTVVYRVDSSQKSTNDDIGKSTRTTSVRTGDENKPLVWLLLCAASLLLLAAIGW
ncbi:MAG: hypothetical protein IKF10_00090, partial [Lachnospiraceae bacterium]|nr:hypothetical protein [Lachnospiraceae bacterium]